MIQLLASGFDPLHHVMDSWSLDFAPFGHMDLPRELFISKHVIFMILSALICCALFIRMARGMAMVPKGRLNNLLEVFVLFIRDEIVKKNMPHDYKAFMPFFLSLFFFIVFCNLLGLLPWGDTPTGDIVITATLAGLICVMQPLVGMYKNGVIHYWTGLVPHGVPGALAPMLFFIELIGLLAKPFALAIRLFANMLAGHMVLLNIFALIFLFSSYMVSAVVVLAVLGFTMLELFVAFLQAYVFVFISSLVLGAAAHPEH